MLSSFWLEIYVISLFRPSSRTSCSVSFLLISLIILRISLHHFLYSLDILYNALSDSRSIVQAADLCNSLWRTLGYPHFKHLSGQSSMLMRKTNLLLRSSLSRWSSSTKDILESCNCELYIDTAAERDSGNTENLLQELWLKSSWCFKPKLLWQNRSLLESFSSYCKPSPPLTKALSFLLSQSWRTLSSSPGRSLQSRLSLR